MRLGGIAIGFAIGILAAASCGARTAVAQTYPTAPVKVIVTTGAGAAPDVIARIVADGLTRRWGQQVFVSNHPAPPARSA